MTASPRAGAWDTDQTLLCERLAERLRHQGSAHPVAAAVALAVRGSLDLDRESFAARFGIDRMQLEHIEAGAVPLLELPAPILLAARHQHGLDLDHLAGLGPSAGEPRRRAR